MSVGIVIRIRVAPAAGVHLFSRSEDRTAGLGAVVPREFFAHPFGERDTATGAGILVRPAEAIPLLGLGTRRLLGGFHKIWMILDALRRGRGLPRDVALLRGRGRHITGGIRLCDGRSLMGRRRRCDGREVTGLGIALRARKGQHLRAQYRRRTMHFTEMRERKLFSQSVRTDPRREIAVQQWHQRNPPGSTPVPAGDR